MPPVANVANANAAAAAFVAAGHVRSFILCFCITCIMIPSSRRVCLTRVSPRYASVLAVGSARPRTSLSVVSRSRLASPFVVGIYSSCVLVSYYSPCPLLVRTLLHYQIPVSMYRTHQNASVMRKTTARIIQTPMYLTSPAILNRCIMNECHCDDRSAP